MAPTDGAAMLQALQALVFLFVCVVAYNFFVLLHTAGKNFWTSERQ
jgi:hypothetical protein